MSPPHPLQGPYRGAPLLLVGTTTTADGAVALNPVFLSLLGDDAAALSTATRGGCCVLAVSLVRLRWSSDSANPRVKTVHGANLPDALHAAPTCGKASPDKNHQLSVI
jgi:hypothetical protein